MEEKQTQNKIFKIVEVPHLKFRVYFCDFTDKPSGIDGGGYFQVMNEDFHKTGFIMSVSVFIEDIENSVKKVKYIPAIAHELTHVLQAICEQYQMNFLKESEHMAYLMYYLLDELLKGKK